MAETGYLLTQEDGGRIARVVLDYESGKLTRQPGKNSLPEANGGSPETIIVQITGAASSGLYPANTVYYNGSAWVAYSTPVRVLELNGNTLTTGNRYLAHFSGPVTVSGTVYGLFVANAATGGSSPTSSYWATLCRVDGILIPSSRWYYGALMRYTNTGTNFVWTTNGNCVIVDANYGIKSPADTPVTGRQYIGAYVGEYSLGTPILAINSLDSQ